MEGGGGRNSVRHARQDSAVENRPSRPKTGLGVGVPTRENMLKLFQHFGFGIAFARADVMQVTGITATPATELMRKMKEAKLIESTKGRGKYKFVVPME